MSIKILLVDDAELQHRLLKRIIDRLEIDIELLYAKSGTDGLELIHTARPDLVILDVVMPDMSGYELAEHIRMVDLSLPLIACTADIQSTTANRLMDLGVNIVINKPIDPNEFQTVLYELMAD